MGNQSVYADSCPISTAGLRALVALLDMVKQERIAQAEQDLARSRALAAFGEGVSVDGLSFELVVDVELITE